MSFYNENPKAAIFPTPVIGMLGLIEDVDNHLMNPLFKEEGDIIYYLGAPRTGLGGSEYLRHIHGLTTGDAPSLDLDFEARLQKLLLELIQYGQINAAHDLSDGGLAVALAEMAIFSGKGAEVRLDAKPTHAETIEQYYSEAQSGVIITVPASTQSNAPKQTGTSSAQSASSPANALLQQCSDAGIPIIKIGVVKGDALNISDQIHIKVSDLKQVWAQTIPEAMESSVTA